MTRNLQLISYEIIFFGYGSVNVDLFTENKNFIYYDKDITILFQDGVTTNLWGRCFTSTSFSLRLFLLVWLKLNLALLLDQLRLV